MVGAELKLHYQEKLYRIYISDTIYYLSQGQRLKTTYSELIGLKKKEDTRSGDEIAADTIKKLGLEVHHDVIHGTDGDIGT